MKNRHYRASGKCYHADDADFLLLHARDSDPSAGQAFHIYGCALIPFGALDEENYLAREDGYSSSIRPKLIHCADGARALGAHLQVEVTGPPAVGSQYNMHEFPIQWPTQIQP